MEILAREKATRDNATFENPKQLGFGLDEMFVIGKLVVREGMLEAFPK